jgi:signal transduction histidine kinase
MSQSSIATQVDSALMQQVQAHNEELRRYLTAQKAVIDSLERRVGRSLDTLATYLDRLTAASGSSAWQSNLACLQNEVNCLSDLLADTLLLQKLEAGKVEIQLNSLNLRSLLLSVSQHLLTPKLGNQARVILELEENLPNVLADDELTEAVLVDLLARGCKYSELTTPIVLGAEGVGDSAKRDEVVRVQIKVTAQRFAPPGDRDFATEIALCCRRIEVQGGEVACELHPDGLQTVTVTLRSA